MSERPDVIVVGGGIGGLSAAAALSRTGIRVRLYERTAEFGEVGAGLQIGPNCTRILDAYGLLDEAKSLGVLPEAMVMKDTTDGRRDDDPEPHRRIRAERGRPGPAAGLTATPGRRWAVRVTCHRFDHTRRRTDRCMSLVPRRR